MGRSRKRSKKDKSRELPLRYVVKSNRFVQARYDWTVMMHRIIMMMIANLRMDDTDFEAQRISVKDIAQLSETAHKDLYAQAAEAARLLLNQKIEIRGEDGEYHGYNLMSDTHYKPGEGYIVARFNPHMRPFLLQLKERFTRYMLEQTMPLSSIYSIRLYELCKMREGVGYIDVSIEDLRSMFMLENKYARFADFRKRVLDTARKELKQKCDVYFEYRVLRNGRTPVAIKFLIVPNTSARTRPEREVSSPATASEVGGVVSPESDAFDQWFESLPSSEQDRLREEAREKALRKDPKASGQVLEFLVWDVLRTMHTELIDSIEG